MSASFQPREPSYFTVSKYNAIPTTVDGIKFDSRLEARRYQYLLLLERSGEIRELQVHPTFELQPWFSVDGKKFRAISYEADFSYKKDDGKFGSVLVVEDCKGTVTAEARLKMKLFAFRFGMAVSVIKKEDF